jgi:tetratricopeptide (TPR) repeat protein
MTKTRSARGPILSEKFLNRAITLVIILIIGAAGAYGGYYLYNRRQMDVSARVASISARYAQQVRKNPLDVEARVNLAQAYITEGNYDEAIKQLKEALKINAEHQGAIVNMGIAYLKKEDNKNAEKYFQKEVSMFGSSGYRLENKYLEEAYFDLAVIYWKKKDYSQALGYAAQATEIGRANSDNHFLMGRIYLSKGSYDEAILKFQESLKFDPKFVDGHYGLAQAYEKKGEKKNAIAEYKQVLKLAPDFKGAKEGIDRLQ